MSALTDRLYGRRGGGWAPHEAGQLLRLLQEGKDPDRRPVDRETLFHPDTIATARAHERRVRGTCASDRENSEPCDCAPSLEDLDEVWAGRARMARARRIAGQPLDHIDRQALYRQGDDIV